MQWRSSGSSVHVSVHGCSLLAACRPYSCHVCAGVYMHLVSGSVASLYQSYAPRLQTCLLTLLCCAALVHQERAEESQEMISKQTAKLLDDR
jgi:hypothetical protein